MSDWKKYRLLTEGEIIQPGDEVDACLDGWRDEPRWEPVGCGCIGRPIVNRACLASILGKEGQEISALKNKLPPWIAIIGISGESILPDEKVAAQEKDIQDIAEQLGLKMVSALAGCNAEDLRALIIQSSPEPYWKLRYKGGSQEIFFLTTLDKTPDFIAAMLSAASEHQYPASDVGVYLQPVHQGVACHCEFILPFNRESQGEVNRIERLFREASSRLFRQKAYFSRPYGIWAEMVFNADAQTTAVARKMKQIFDPKRVMNPGKLCF